MRRDVQFSPEGIAALEVLGSMVGAHLSPLISSVLADYVRAKYPNEFRIALSRVKSRPVHKRKRKKGAPVDAIVQPNAPDFVRSIVSQALKDMT